jgi:hypothetical protein
MKLIPIIVDSHSGYKADDYPVNFYLDKIKYEIKEISDRWFQAQPAPDGPIANYFKVRTSGKTEYLIKHELTSDQWFLVTTQEKFVRFFAN